MTTLLKNLFIAAIIIFLFSLMNSCKYEDDFSFVSDSRAGLFSEEVYINNFLCQDMSKTVGACTLQIASNAPLTYRIAPRPYAYRLTLVCSSKINFQLSREVKEMELLEFQIPNDKFDTQSSFTCIGEVFPQDRDEAVSIKFETRIKIHKPNLILLDKPFIQNKDGKDYIVFGKYALHGRVCSKIKCGWIKKKPYIEVPFPNIISIRSESASGRTNYYRKETI